MNQGVNLLCREGNSQPGHWMLIPERPRERGKKMLLNPERKKSRSQIASNKIWKGSQFPLFLLSFYHFLLSLLTARPKRWNRRAKRWTNESLILVKWILGERNSLFLLSLSSFFRFFHWLFIDISRLWKWKKRTRDPGYVHWIPGDERVNRIMKV